MWENDFMMEDANVEKETTRRFSLMARYAIFRAETRKQARKSKEMRKWSALEELWIPLVSWLTSGVPAWVQWRFNYNCHCLFPAVMVCLAWN